MVRDTYEISNSRSSDMSNVESGLISPHAKSTVVSVEESPPVVNNKSHINETPKNAKDMVAIARAAFKSGKTKSIKFRRQQLINLYNLLKDNSTAFEEAFKVDLGRHPQESSTFDIDYTKFNVQKVLMHLDEWVAPEKPSTDLIFALDNVKILNDPYGVVLVIGSWNFPINLVLIPLAAAIAAGNCVIMKPSELAEACAKLITDLVPKYLDKECYQVYNGGIPETTELLEQRFDYIFFTGSTMVGKIVHAAANKFLTPATLELGGKSPCYIDDTVDIEIATRRILWGKYSNAGQICISPDYLLCTKQIQQRFIAAASQILKEWYGSDPKSSPYYSRLISDKHYQRLMSFLKDKQNIAVGGRSDANERFIEPTILVDVNPNDPVMQEEIFGPILPIIVIENASEAVSFINAREKPLALYVFTNDRKVKDLFLNNTSSGGVSINDTLMHFTVDSLPFGGVGHSGMGAYHGKTSFDTFVHKKGVLERSLQKLQEKPLTLRYPPFSKTKIKLINTLVTPRPKVPIKLLGYFLAFCLGIIFVIIVQLIYKAITN